MSLPVRCPNQLRDRRERRSQLESHPGHSHIDPEEEDPRVKSNNLFSGTRLSRVCAAGVLGSILALSGAPAALAQSPAASEGIPAWCGTKPITLSVSDGFGGNNWRRITSGEAKAEASLCPSVKNYVYTDGQGDVQKSISDLNGLAAQGTEAMVVFPDAGEAMLPAIRAAYQAG